MRSPKPRPPIVDASRNLSNNKRFDRTRTTRDSPARHAAAAPQTRRTQATAQDRAATPHPGRKRQAAPKPGTPRENPRPGSQHQSAESGQSQEPPSEKTDIKPIQARYNSRTVSDSTFE